MPTPAWRTTDDLIAAARRSAARERAIKDEIGNGGVEQSGLRRVLDPHGL